MKAKTGFKYAGFGVLGVAAVFGFALVVMWLWNWLVPEVFNGPVLSYWQTFGLLILSKILFSGIGGKSSRSHSKHYKYSGECPPMPKSRWRQKYEAKMNGKVEEQEGSTTDESDEGEVIVPE